MSSVSSASVSKDQAGGMMGPKADSAPRPKAADKIPGEKNLEREVSEPHLPKDTQSTVGHAKAKAAQTNDGRSKKLIAKYQSNNASAHSTIENQLGSQPS